MLKKIAVAAVIVAAGLPAAHAQSSGSSTGAVFAATNDAKQNEIIMYSRAADGTLHLIDHFPTGGRGEGGINDPLQSDYSVVLTANHSFLLVVNAGSSDISVFRVFPEGLELASVTPSGGGNPVSIAVHNGLVYVVNTGGTTHTAGFRLDRSGKLTPLPNSVEPLSSLDSGASSAVFNSDGSKLIVTERLTSLIDVFTVNSNGSLSNPVFNPSQGNEPFGPVFTPGNALLVTEATFGKTTASTSAYTVNADNSLSVVTSSSPSAGVAACWIATDGHHAWVSNTGTSSLGAYSVAQNGALQPLGIAATVPATVPTVFPAINPPTSFPLDLALTGDGRFLYGTFSGTGQIIGFRIGQDGALTPFDSVAAEQPQIGAEGLAVY